MKILGLGQKLGKMGLIQRSTTPYDVEGTMTKGLSWRNSPSQCREIIKEWVPLLNFALSFSIEHSRGNFFSLAPCQQLEYVAMRRKFTAVQCLQASPWRLWPVSTSICSASQGPLFASLLSAQLVLVDSGPNSLLLCLWVSDCSFFSSEHSISLSSLHPKEEPSESTWAGDRCLYPQRLHPQHLTLRWVVLFRLWGPSLSLLMTTRVRLFTYQVSPYTWQVRLAEVETAALSLVKKMASPISIPDISGLSAYLSWLCPPPLGSWPPCPFWSHTDSTSA